MSRATLEKKLKQYENPIEDSFAKWLYTHLPPCPITSKKLHEQYQAAIQVLMHEISKEGASERISGIIREYLNSILPFVEDYERKEFPMKTVTPEEILKFLMEQNDLSQYDIASDVGGQPVVSDILRGKRKLSREHIERLSKRFNIRPATFFPD